MTKSDKIREYFRKHPSADVAKVAAKFEAPKPMTYKLRKQVQETDAINEDLKEQEWKPKRTITLSRAQSELATRLSSEAGVPLTTFIKAQLANGTMQYDDEREPEPEGADIDETLDDRAQDYGKFIQGAEIMQMLKRIVHNYIEARGTKLAFDQREAIDMIIHKLGRIINGNPDKVDSWVDIAGYAKLVADRLEGVER